MTTAEVVLWGKQIAAVTWVDSRNLAVFQYAPEFINSGIQVAPLTMPLVEGTFVFPALSRESFKGLPGLLADSLPDKFGNALINKWLETQSRSPESFNPVERLCYIGSRGMGALEFFPALKGVPSSWQRVEVESLVRLANRVLSQRESLAGKFTGSDDEDSIQDILRVGTSAGGARAKAILAWNEQTDEFRSGQVDLDPGFTQWLMKFDGIDKNRDKELADPQGYGKIEYAYHLMAVNAGIEMTRCRLHHEGGRAHFMTQRFDRTEKNEKLHMQSLGAMMHFDFNQSGAYSYEQAIAAMMRLELPMSQIEQQFRRAVFNVMARNQDDHVKNIAFLMNREGRWNLSPAFDVGYSFNPSGAWTSQHQMSVNGKQDGFQREDLISLANVGGIKAKKAKLIIEQVGEAIKKWDEFAAESEVADSDNYRIARTLRLELVAS